MENQHKKVILQKVCHSRGVGGPQGSGIFRVLSRCGYQTRAVILNLIQDLTSISKNDAGYSLCAIFRIKPCEMTKSSVRGFTLIELLVVVLMIGILAAVALPQYNKAVEKSRISEALVFMDSVYKAAQLCILEKGEDNCFVHEESNPDTTDFLNNMNIEMPGALQSCQYFAGGIPQCWSGKDFEYYIDMNILYASRLLQGEDAGDDLYWALYDLQQNLTTGETKCSGSFCKSICGSTYCKIH